MDVANCVDQEKLHIFLEKYLRLAESHFLYDGDLDFMLEKYAKYVAYLRCSSCFVEDSLEAVFCITVIVTLM